MIKMFLFLKILASLLKVLRVQSGTMTGELVNDFLHIVLKCTTHSYSLFRKKILTFLMLFALYLLNTMHPDTRVHPKQTYK